ncbi:MAG TPA: biotin--[acetyl-CoA-carboxylase] ligase [Streptosporangiaceae bacterium]|nr:biotin--[acetyl-CoA-carboxylase] ligase [Streptosporangiaceae bacterium]
MTEAPHDETPLDEATVRAAVLRPGGLWRSIEVVAVTGSTNADLLARAAAGEPEGAVLVAEQQNAGRGRLGRAWVSPPRAALTFSVLLRPAAVPRALLGWLPLLAGVAVAAAVRDVAAVDAQLKWPNDVLAGPAGVLAGGSGPAAAGGQGSRAAAGGQGSRVVPPRKLGGILAEAAGDAVVIGIGLNVSTGRAELPPPGPGALAATSLRLEGSPNLDRERLLAGILAGLERRYRTWSRVSGDPERSGLRAEYTGLCATLGRRVRVELPGGRQLDGLAAGVDPDGRLLVRMPPDPDLRVAAGDVLHLR